MTALQSTDAQREFPYSRRDFERVKSLLFKQAGINLADSKDAMVYSRLARRLRALEIHSFKEYLAYVGSCKDEMEHFINDEIMAHSTVTSACTGQTVVTVLIHNLITKRAMKF